MRHSLNHMPLITHNPTPSSYSPTKFLVYPIIVDFKLKSHYLIDESVGFIVSRFITLIKSIHAVL